MKKTVSSILNAFLIILVSASLITAQNQQNNLSRKIQNDPNVIVGKLDNGFTYYILKNGKPEKRAEFRLAVRAGAVVEDDDQNGLAHFTEHMAFNGTKNFPGQGIIKYLESIGVRFGYELNAFTGQDFTNYILPIPLEKPEYLEKALMILRDWAGNISFTDKDIDAERGVIVEEWRLGRGAQGRLYNKQSKVIFNGSKYAERDVIGEKNILENFKYETIRRFYKDWYRTDLMALVAVGDFDVKEIEKQIVKYFSDLKPVSNPRERIIYPVPKHQETLYSIETDKELGATQIAVLYKKDSYATVTLADFKKDIVNNIASSMLSARLSEKSRELNAPFSQAAAFGGTYAGPLSVFQVAVMPKENNIEKAMQAVLLEVERAKKYGFTETEFNRAKAQFLRQKEQSVIEKNKTENAVYINRIVRNFLEKESYPTVEEDLANTKAVLPLVTLKEVNDYLAESTPDQNRVVTVSMPEKEGIVKPTKEALATIFEEVKKEKLDAYVDKTITEDLISYQIKPGKIANEKTDSEYGITDITLSNGVRVVLKPTDFKNNEILFRAFSPGGASLSDDKDYFSVQSSVAAVTMGGIGKFSQTELRKFLTGKMVNVTPLIADIMEGFNGRGTKEDLETMFKLIHLYFTSPRKDTVAFNSYKEMMKAQIKTMMSDPNFCLNDTLNMTTYAKHPRIKPVTVERYTNVDYEKAFSFYKERFADASDFTFVFVGSIDLSVFKPLLEKYLGSLPSINRKETYKDTGIRYINGKAEKIVKKGIEPKGSVYIRFMGDMNWSSRESYYLTSLGELLSIKLREVIREDKSGTYGIGVYPAISRKPYESYSLNITFGCNPERTEELYNTIMTQLDSISNFGPSQLYVNKVKEGQLKAREKELKENNSWMNWVYTNYYNGLPMSEMAEYKDRVNSLTPELFKSIAKKYINKERFVKGVLLPENK